MRRLASLAVASAAALLLGAAPAVADNGPHVLGSAGVLADSCAGCHRVHTARTDQLTTQAQPNLCYTCHGSTGAGAQTDVQDGVSRSGSPRALRGGGFEYALIDSSAASGQRDTWSNDDGVVPALDPADAQQTTSAHSVDGSPVTAYGYGPVVEGAPADPGPSFRLLCTSCHDPHGNGNYRILRPNPFDPTSPTGVAIADSTQPRVYTTANYWSVGDPDAPGFIRNSAEWCSTCHTRYLAGVGAGHKDSTDAIYAYRHRSDDVQPGSATCVQCHVAHGSNAAFDPASSPGTVPAGRPLSAGVVHPDASRAGVPVSGDGNRLLRIDNRGTCQMCHGPVP